MMTFHKFELVAATYPVGWIMGAFALGALWGSFLNVCIYRIPAGQSVVWKSSHCRLCQRRIRWYDNVPIISWCFLKGRCRDCGQFFSPRYCLVELLAAALFALCAWRLNVPSACVGMLFASLLIVVAFIDLDHFVIPEVGVFSGAFLGLVISGVYPSLLGQTHAIEGVSQSLMGAFIGSGLIFWLLAIAERVLRKPAIGLGDVLLLGMIGAYTGWMGAVFALFAGAAIGAVVLLPLMVLERALGVRIGPRAKPDELFEERFIENQSCTASPELSLGIAVPFGPWLAVGGFVYFLLFQNQFTLNFIFRS